MPEDKDLTADITPMRKIVKEPASHLEKLIVIGTDDEVVAEVKKVFGEDIVRIAEYLGRFLHGKETARIVLLVCKSIDEGIPAK